MKLRVLALLLCVVVTPLGSRLLAQVGPLGTGPIPFVSIVGVTQTVPVSFATNRKPFHRLPRSWRRGHGPVRCCSYAYDDACCESWNDKRYWQYQR